MAAFGRMPGAPAVTLAVVAAGLIVYGLTTAAPLVDFATDEEAALKATGVLRVRIGCGLTAAAGLVLVLSSSWWPGQWSWPAPSWSRSWPARARCWRCCSGWEWPPSPSR